MVQKVQSSATFSLYHRVSPIATILHLCGTFVANNGPMLTYDYSLTVHSVH